MTWNEKAYPSSFLPTGAGSPAASATCLTRCSSTDLTLLMRWSTTLSLCRCTFPRKRLSAEALGSFSTRKSTLPSFKCSQIPTLAAAFWRSKAPSASSSDASKNSLLRTGWTLPCRLSAHSSTLPRRSLRTKRPRKTTAATRAATCCTNCGPGSRKSSPHTTRRLRYLSISTTPQGA